MRCAAAICALWLLSMTVGAPAAWARVEERQVLALVRALAYDRELGDRAGGDVAVAVVYDLPHEADAYAIADVLMSLDGVTLQDRPLTTAAPIAAEGVTAGALEGIDVVVVVTSPASAAAVVVAARSAGSVTAGFNASLIHAGVPLVVSDEGGELEVTVNLPASRAAGQAYSSKLLQIARVVRESP